MCGIVGLYLKDQRLAPELGAHLETMLIKMTDRGPDSAGFAVYGDPIEGMVRLTIRSDAAEPDFESLSARLGSDVRITAHGNHALALVPATSLEQVQTVIAAEPDLVISSRGERVEMYRDVGLPASVAKRFGLSRMQGTHGIGHTRMATESAVTVDGAHPFSTGNDQCLVHNGSLSNHNDLRRRLRREGMEFRTENDSEVAAAYLSWRMNQGDSFGDALTHALDDLDGFYTFVVGTGRGFGVLRDPISCKPAVLAETDAWVAFGSEYQVLTDLPGIDKARVWEPKPATPYFWER
ncbi:class II glutamine amidotransferase [Aquibaculum sediminis]|uniref:class II glutamine amidotransferase n=1 Tax=Aquibaculum sediminis TaxID=3231907 RepID=UPI0034565909